MSLATHLDPERGDRPQEAVPPGTVRAEGLLRAVDRLFLRLDRAIHRVLPAEHNPLTQTGAIANTMLLVATISGVVLLYWYVPSVHHAYDSVIAMADAPLTAGLTRSIHRYSSDAAMFLVLLHAAKLFFARRFTGARWLAWVTGIAAVGLLWTLGWSGYWLVWDEGARRVAVGTATMLDVLPIFADPLSRSFLTDTSVNSLLFFVVFFAHMLIPLALIGALWLHVARMSRPGLFPRRGMTTASLATLLLLSLLLPADQGPAASMTAWPQHFPMDAWYLAPLVLTDRLGAGALWSLTLFGGIALFTLPWWLGRPAAAPRPALVDADRCNACRRCTMDCPYDAVAMVPSPGSRHGEVALVDPDKCVACGICAGACDSSAVQLPWFDTLTERRRIEGWLADDRSPVAMVCAASAGGGLAVDAEGRSAALPGWRVEEVPCAGWVHALTIERALKRGASQVLVAACEPGDCTNREGGAWISQRVAGVREPMLRHEQVDAERVRVVHLGRPATDALIDAAQALRAGRRAPKRPRGRSAAVLAATVLALLVWGGTRIGYAAPRPEQPQLVVSFKHPGTNDEACRTLTEAELAERPVHMRKAVECSRERAPVRLKVRVDGEVVHEASYRPRGLWKDGNSIALARIPLAPGEHRVEVAVGETHAPEWSFEDSRTVTLEEGRDEVVLFDRIEGFRWF